MVSELEQIIPCPNCEGSGWRKYDSKLGYYECPVCETRGLLVIDAEKTMARPMRPLRTRNEEMK